MPRALLLINRHSRRGAELRHEAQEHLNDLGFDVTEAWPQSPERTVEFLRERCEGVDCVVVGGGDGTLISMAGGLAEVRRPMGIIPLGTMNDLARSLGIPKDVRAACEVVAAGRTRVVDAASVNGKFFLNEASIGVSTAIARKQTEDVKRRFGLLAIAGTAFLAVRYSRPFRATIERHGGETLAIRTIQLTVANSYHFGAWITDRDSAIDDGQLDLYALQVARWHHVIPLLGAIVRKELHGAKGILALRGPAFTVRTRKPRPVYTDGERATMTPATFRVHPGALTVFVPDSASTNGAPT